MPLRRVLPPAGRFDTASLVALLAVQLVATLILFRLRTGALFPFVPLAVAALRSLALATLLLYTILIFVYAALSFIAPGARSPATALLASLCEPLLRPLRQRAAGHRWHRLLAAGRDRRPDGPAHPDRLSDGLTANSGPDRGFPATTVSWRRRRRRSCWPRAAAAAREPVAEAAPYRRSRIRRGRRLPPALRAHARARPACCDCGQLRHCAETQSSCADGRDRAAGCAARTPRRRCARVEATAVSLTGERRRSRSRAATSREARPGSRRSTCAIACRSRSRSRRARHPAARCCAPA